VHAVNCPAERARRGARAAAEARERYAWPALAEAVAVSALGAVVRETGIRLHVVHLSSAAGVAAARAARAAGADLSLETCPQYLWFTAGDYDRLGPLMKVYPPVRTEADRSSLRDALLDGTIALVASDHAPHSDDDKNRSLDSAPAGAPGVQTLLLSCLQLAAEKGDIGLAVRWTAERPARLLGLSRKGSLQAGADADLVLIDPRQRTRVSADSMLSRQRHGMFEGVELDFAIRAVYSRGELVAIDGAVVGSRGRGRLLTPDA
jgi:dihydroorotase-like cyclic amidohydrolase